MKEHAEITVRDIANRTSSHMVIKDNGNGSTLWRSFFPIRCCAAT